MSNAKKSFQSNTAWTRTNLFARSLVGISTFALIVFFCSSPVSAQVNWTNTSNSSAWYQNSGNWSPWGAPTATEMAQFNAASPYEVWWSSTTQTQTPSVGFLNVTAGDIRFVNQQISAQYELTINGSGGDGLTSDFSISGANTKLTAAGIHLHSLGGARILDGATFTLDQHPAGSQFSTDGSSGFTIDGNFNVLDGSIATNVGFNRIGSLINSVGNAQISGVGSKWTADVVSAGTSGQGSLLIESGGVVNSSNSFIGHFGTGFGSATVTGSGSQWNGANQLTVGGFGEGELIIEQGGVVSSSTAMIGAFNNGTYAGNGTVEINGVGSELKLSSTLDVGLKGNAIVNVSGGKLTSQNAWVGRDTGSFGDVSIQGSTGSWDNENLLTIGKNGNGTLTIDGGNVTSGSSFIGNSQNGSGTVVVENSGQWTNSNTTLAREGFAYLRIESGGKVITSGNSYTTQSDGYAAISVYGVDSVWETSGDLYLGGVGYSSGLTTLDIGGGRVTVGGTTKIWSAASVNVDGGRFEFGQTTLDEYNSINQYGGSMSGLVHATGYQSVNSLSAFRNPAVDISDVQYGNQGVLQGGGVLNSGLANQASGEVRILSNESVRFAGNTNTNAGEINNFGGVIEFEQSATNESTGFVTGRGQFIANGGWTNSGVMAFSGGPADVLGDVNNESGGQIVTTGGATTTFYDDVVHNGTEIRTAAGSNTVFFGSQSGAGAFTGTGTVYYEGDLRPGNSPASVSYEGSLVLGSFANTFIELAGLEIGEFDQFLIEGNLDLDGTLSVGLIDGFQLSFNDEFLIAQVDGDLNGQFAGLIDGALVGNYGGHDLFISYSSGDGNDVALFTAVPEPGTGSFLLLTLLGMTGLRRKKRNLISSH